MTKIKSGVLIIISLFSIVICEKFRFDNYSLYRITVNNDVEREIIEELRNEEPELDFWNEPRRNVDYALVMSKPSDKEKLESFLKKHNIDFTITINDIQKHIENENVGRYSRSNHRNMTWDRYYDLGSINAWLDDIVVAHSDVASLIFGGLSHERREIKGVKISHGSGRKIVFIEGGIHSREWIAMSTVNFIINELLTSNDEMIRQTARDVDWYIFPVTNPDGYVWSHENFRLWRKNRREIVRTGILPTIGVDLNRNWNHAFLLHGASTNGNSDLFAGLGPFSEPETRSLSAYIRSISSRMEMYLSFHSFGQMLLLPFGNSTEPLGNYHEAVSIGRRAMGALSVRYNTRYEVGNIAETIYLATGGSIDWVKDHLNIPLVYCYELRENGTYGFLLPEEQILPNNLEAMDSVVELIHQAKRFGYL